MRLSISISNASWPIGTATVADTLERIAGRADAAGVDTIWVPDHLLQLVPGTDPADGMLEAYTTLGYLAAMTETVRLGTMVTAPRGTHQFTCAAHAAASTDPDRRFRRA